MKKVVLLRHGESIWNKENRFTGWTDVDLSEQGIAEAQKAAAKRVRVQFNSKEYFDLLIKQPEVSRWLALGQNVQFVHKNTLYEVFE